MEGILSLLIAVACISLTQGHYYPSQPWQPMPNRPCNLNDTENLDECVRQYISKHANCFLTRDRLPDSVVIPEFVANIPSVNSTLVVRNYRISGLMSSRFVDFYQTADGMSMVFAFRVERFNGVSSQMTAMFQRRAEEPIVITDSLMIKIPSVIFTVMITPSLGSNVLNNFQMYVEGESGSIEVGNRILRSQDRQVQYTMRELRAHEAIVIRENVGAQAPFILKYVIERVFCNFGVGFMY